MDFVESALKDAWNYIDEMDFEGQKQVDQLYQAFMVIVAVLLYSSSLFISR